LGLGFFSSAANCVTSRTPYSLPPQFARKTPHVADSLLLRLFAQRGVKMFVCINLQQTTTGDEDEDDDDDGGGSGSPGAEKREG